MNELLVNYHKAVASLFAHLKFNLGGEWEIVDCSMYYWHLAPDKVLYSPDKNVDDNPFSSSLITHYAYDIRVFGGSDLTAIIGGKLTTEVLLIFDNTKYVGDAKHEKIYV